MHNALIMICFLLLILVPCIVAMRSSSKEGKTGNSGEHSIPERPTIARGHTPSRIRDAAAAMAARKQAKLDTANGVVLSDTTATPSSAVLHTDNVFSRPAADTTAVSSTAERPSRIRMVAAALTQRKPKGPVPMASGDPGSKKLSIKELRAKQANARTPRT